MMYAGVLLVVVLLATAAAASRHRVLVEPHVPEHATQSQLVALATQFVADAEAAVVANVDDERWLRAARRDARDATKAFARLFEDAPIEYGAELSQITVSEKDTARDLLRRLRRVVRHALKRHDDDDDDDDDDGGGGASSGGGGDVAVGGGDSGDDGDGATPPAADARCASLGQGVRLSWTMGTDVVHFSVMGAGKGWLGVGFSRAPTCEHGNNCMVNADYVVASSTGVAHLELDASATRNGRPTPIAVDAAAGAGFAMDVQTAPGGDAPTAFSFTVPTARLASPTQTVLFAYGTDDQPDMTFHGERHGVKTITWLDASTCGGADDGVVVVGDDGHGHDHEH